MNRSSDCPYRIICPEKTPKDKDYPCHRCDFLLRGLLTRKKEDKK